MARWSGEVNGVRQEPALSRARARFRVGHRELLCRLGPNRKSTDVLNRTPDPHGIRCTKRREQAAPRANGSMRKIVWTNVRDNTRVNDGGQSKDARGKNCGSYCGAHRLPAGRTAAKEDSKRASCRSGRKTDRRSTTATVQGIGPFRENRRILVTAREPSQRFFEVFSFESVIRRGCESFLSPLHTAFTQHGLLRSLRCTRPTQRALARWDCRPSDRDRQCVRCRF